MEDIKLSLLTDGMILYIENPKNCTKIQLNAKNTVRTNT